MMTNIPVDPANPTTPVNHNQSAQELIDQIRAMRDRIPYFTIPATPTDGSSLVRGASVPAAFVELTAVALKNSPALVRGGGADPGQLRDMQTYATAYSPFADELEALALFVRHSVLAAKHNAGTEAFTTYELAKRLAKRPATADLRPHVADMRRALAAGRRKAKPTPAPGPAPAPTPAPVPVTPDSSPAATPPVMTTSPSTTQ
jgi:hypothetical protein